MVVMSTGCLFHLPLPQIAAIARTAGFAGLDLVMGSPKIAPGAEVEAAHALCPVRVVHAPFRNWSAWGGHLNAWRAAVDLAGGLAGGLAGENGSGVHVTLHPPAGTLRDAIQTRWFSRAVDLPRLLGVAPGVSLSLENLPWSGNGASLFGKDDFAELVAECLNKGLGLTLDVCHLGVSGRDLLADLGKVPAGLLRHVHFSDAQGYTEHLPPGQGALPLGPFLARLGRTGYAQTVSLELDPSQLPDVQAQEGEADVVRVLSTLRQGMAAALAGDPPPEWGGRQQGGRT
ncbi:MAG: sugar phosphate isomerase/epimerase, partial [Humidesulfovibrio sp.]|nr:sugar phosphate isomerase/epimerase [Humidesulfovibrio sp.]